MQTLLAFAVCAFLFFSLGVYIQYRYGVKKIVAKAKEELTGQVAEILDKAEKLKDAAEDEIGEGVAELAELAKRIRRN